MHAHNVHGECVRSTASYATASEAAATITTAVTPAAATETASTITTAIPSATTTFTTPTITTATAVATAVAAFAAAVRVGSVGVVRRHLL